MPRVLGVPAAVGVDRVVLGVQACGLRRVRHDAQTCRPSPVSGVQSTAAEGAAEHMHDNSRRPLFRPSLCEPSVHRSQAAAREDGGARAELAALHRRLQGLQTVAGAVRTADAPRTSSCRPGADAAVAVASARATTNAGEEYAARTRAPVPRPAVPDLLQDARAHPQAQAASCDADGYVVRTGKGGEISNPHVRRVVWTFLLRGAKSIINSSLFRFTSDADRRAASTPRPSTSLCV